MVIVVEVLLQHVRTGLQRVVVLVVVEPVLTAMPLAKSARVEWTAVMWRAMPLVRVRLRVVLVRARRPSSAARAAANAKRSPHWPRWNGKTPRVEWAAALPMPAAVRSASSWRQPRPGISTSLS